MFGRVAYALSLISLCATVAWGTVSLPSPGPGGSVGTAFTYATFDAATLTGGGSLSGGNLTYSSTGSASVVRSTKFAASKFYFEYTIVTSVSGSGFLASGVVDSAQSAVTPTSLATVPAGMWINRNDSNKANNAGSGAYGSNWGAGVVLSIAVDNTLGSGSGKVWIGQCSAGTITWPSSGDPVAGTNTMYANLTGNIGALVNTQSGTATSLTANFGATAYACTAPTGYGNL